VDVVTSYCYGEPVMVDEPRGYGNSLEWATSCPPPRHNFRAVPRIVPSVPPSSCTTPHMIPRMREEARVMSAFGGHGVASLSEHMANSTAPDETSGSDKISITDSHGR